MYSVAAFVRRGGWGGEGGPRLCAALGHVWYESRHVQVALNPIYLLIARRVVASFSRLNRTPSATVHSHSAFRLTCCSTSMRKGTTTRGCRQAATAPSASTRAARTTSTSAVALVLMDEPHGQPRPRNAASEHSRTSPSASLVSATSQHSACAATSHASERLRLLPLALAGAAQPPEPSMRADEAAWMHLPMSSVAAAEPAAAAAQSSRLAHRASDGRDGRDCSVDRPQPQPQPRSRAAAAHARQPSSG